MAGAQVLRWPKDTNDPQTHLSYIFAQLAAKGVCSVLVEAGSALNGTLLAGHWVDRLILYKTQKPLGPEAVPFAKALTGPEVIEAQLTDRQTATFPHPSADSEDLRVSGYLRDPWAGI